MVSNKLGAEDRLDIIALFARYAWAYDSGDKDGYVNTFTHDGVLADGNGVLGTGHAQIGAALQTFMDLRGPEQWQHLNDHYLIEGTGVGQATVRSYWVVIAASAQGGSYILGQGDYVTDVVHIDGGWLIKRRTFYSRGTPRKRE